MTFEISLSQINGLWMLIMHKRQVAHKQRAGSLKKICIGVIHESHSSFSMIHFKYKDMLCYANFVYLSPYYADVLVNWCKNREMTPTSLEPFRISFLMHDV